jgi:hypothetical protein
MILLSAAAITDLAGPQGRLAERVAARVLYHPALFGRSSHIVGLVAFGAVRPYRHQEYRA